jgi:hypothetical protein
MRPCQYISLEADQRQQLLWLRDHAAKAYLRERAAAILKVSDGTCVGEVAANGLLRKRKQDTLRAWLARYIEQGIDGLGIRPGRGRKPAFSP